MRAELRSFLDAEDLDALLSARMQISVLDRVDSQELSAIVRRWTDKQAIANLLMYPEVIPASDRIYALLKGLDEDETEYLVLAAVVGLQNLADDAIPEQERKVVARKLLSTLSHPSETIASRVTVTVANYIEHLDHRDLLAFLGHPDGTVKHNILVALLPLVGREHIKDLVRAKIDEAVLPPETADFVDRELAVIDGAPRLPGDDPLLGTPLSVPLLSYIPNYRDWHA